MTYTYHCKKCDKVYDREAKAFDPPNFLECEVCECMTKRVFTPNGNIVNNMSDKTK